MPRITRLAVIGLLVGSMFAATSAQAQDINTLFGNAQVATQQMVNQIRAGLAAGNLAVSRTQAQAAVVSGQQAIASLQQILTLNPTDAQRSRAQGLIDHLVNAVRSAQLAVSGPDADVLTNLNAARGEAEEALVEFPPVGAPGLPGAGDESLTQTFTIAGIFGATLVLGGMWLRRRSASGV